MTLERLMGLSALLCVFTSCHTGPEPHAAPAAVVGTSPAPAAPIPPTPVAPAPLLAPAVTTAAVRQMAQEASASADPEYAELRTLLATKRAEKEEPSCEPARAQVLLGVAREEDLWLAVHCALDALQDLDDYDRVERLLAIASTAYEAHSNWFYQVVPSPHCDMSAGLAVYGVKVLPEDNKEPRLFLGDSARRADVTAKISCQLGSGTYRGTCLPFFRNAGHSDVTLRSLKILGGGSKEQKLSPAAIEILSDAAQDPDFFAWSNMAAHAQTPDDDGVPRNVEVAKEAFVTFVNGYLTKAAMACEPATRDIQASLYWTGYALHAVQDLASHRGRTNPEHAYNAKFEQNPDEKELSIDRARTMTTDLLRELMRGKLKKCLPSWRTYAGPQVPFRKKRGSTEHDFGLEFEFTPWAVVEYKLSHSKFKKALATNQTTARTRWFGDIDDNGSKDDCRWNTPEAAKSACSQLLANIYR